MDYIVVCLDIITMLLTAWMCAAAARKWKNGHRVVFYFIFVFFYVVPIFLDYLYAFPTYTYSANMNGFELSHKDSLTRVLYDILVLIVQWLLLNIKIKKSDSIVIKDEKTYYNGMTAFLYIGLLAAPVLVLLLGADKSILYTFMWRENELSEVGYLPIAERLSYVGIACAVVLFFWKSQKNKFIRRVLSVVFAYVNICIEGKRSITFFLFLVVLIVMLPGVRDTSLTPKQRKRMIFALIIVLALVLAIMIIFTVKVKMENRGYADVDSVYTSLRIDIFRDDRVRMALYAFLYPDKMTILTYPGQTIIPSAITFFPLDYIFGFMRIRPIAYTAYISAALVGSSTVSQTDAFMSPSIFAELTSNFHILGIIIFVWLTLWFSKVAQRYPYPVNVFIFVSYVLLHMYSISYIAYFLEVAFILCILCRRKFKKEQSLAIKEQNHDSGKV